MPIRKKGVWVLLDRGPFDILADPKRYRSGAPLWIRRIWCKLQPSAQHTFVLTASAEIIHERKAEVELESLRRLLVNYRNLEGKGVKHISVEQPVEQVVSEILEHLEIFD